MVSHKTFGWRTSVRKPNPQHPPAAVEVAGKLAKLSGDVDAKVLGFQVLPRLLDRLRHDRGVLAKLIKLETNL